MDIIFFLGHEVRGGPSCAWRPRLQVMLAFILAFMGYRTLTKAVDLHAKETAARTKVTTGERVTALTVTSSVSRYRYSGFHMLGVNLKFVLPVYSTVSAVLCSVLVLGVTQFSVVLCIKWVSQLLWSLKPALRACPGHGPGRGGQGGEHAAVRAVERHELRRWEPGGSSLGFWETAGKHKPECTWQALSSDALD